MPCGSLAYDAKMYSSYEPHASTVGAEDGTGDGDTVVGQGDGDGVVGQAVDGDDVDGPAVGFPGVTCGKIQGPVARAQ